MIDANRRVGHIFKPLLESDIRRSQLTTHSAAEAARYLNVSYDTYKKYAKMYGLFEQHKNQKGLGIARRKKKGVFGLDEILAGKHPYYNRTKLKERLIKAAYLEESCARCGFEKRREIDGKVPLVLQCIDGDNHNLVLENLELRCYNCFHGDERFLTIDGIKTFRETVGSTQMVLNVNKEWVPAKIEEFGIQPLCKVMLKPPTRLFGRTIKTVTCTPTHKWITHNRGEVTDLRVGDLIPLTLSKQGVYKVLDISPTTPDIVYCAVEPQTKTFTLADGLLTGNCTALMSGYLSTRQLVADQNPKKLLNPGVYDQDLLDTGMTADDITDIQDELMGE